MLSTKFSWFQVSRGAVLDSEAYVLVYIKQQPSARPVTAENSSKILSSPANCLSPVKPVSQLVANPTTAKVSGIDPSKVNLHQVHSTSSGGSQNLKGKNKERVISNLFGTMKVRVGDKNSGISHKKLNKMAYSREKLGKQGQSINLHQDRSLDGFTGKSCKSPFDMGDEHHQSSNSCLAADITHTSPLCGRATEEKMSGSGLQSPGKLKSRKRSLGKRTNNALEEEDRPASKRLQFRYRCMYLSSLCIPMAALITCTWQQ